MKTNLGQKRKRQQRLPAVFSLAADGGDVISLVVVMSEPNAAASVIQRKSERAKRETTRVRAMDLWWLRTVVHSGAAAVGSFGCLSGSRRCLRIFYPRVGQPNF
ncbi:hypothetical protein L2E82_13660 [Cichorium intybus]|uniref:Uncharacterized protein n=1 Tax=Cichorium intybus TaxID=13427 RepID=A0ACB9EY63_CICIN|nr:hypothetical protein L2E82_13660 [Cichorium intybus]